MKKILILIFLLLFAIDTHADTLEIVDSYNESNYSEELSLGSGTSLCGGQSFTSTTGGTLDSAKFYLKKVGSLTGNVTARIYSHTGTYGISSKPTGSPLATSDNVDVNTIGTDYSLITFTFSGANRISLNSSTYYVVVINYTGGDYPTAYLAMGADSTSPSHSGNLSFAYTDCSSWNAYISLDFIFYVYKQESLINTRDKRASIINMLLPSFGRVLPTPGQ